MTHQPPAIRDGPDYRLRSLGRYTNEHGHERELIACDAAAGSVLVVDRDLDTLGDRRLVAHLGADEPPINAALTCERYLRDPSRGRCRRVDPLDLTVDPCARSAGVQRGHGLAPARLADPRDGTIYRLARVSGRSMWELRWRAHQPGSATAASRPRSLREVVGALESYEPACELSADAMTRHRFDASVSVATLRSELTRLRDSPIVLNRGLRDAVREAIELDGLSMSEIALRCGRVKQDAKGNRSGETSWLARRLGLVPESGADCPTPWIHTDVLALIARSGLGVSPREVELQ